jgi:uncharacterized protein YyaL (SSP411 family)
MSNRLGNASSPYLRMHADDPVDWFPWGEEAFSRAVETKRLIFLSSGYASCHWCHVMQRESFKDPETATFLNEHFVPVKVDREMRPDVDALYMDYVVATMGHGGWPMSVFITPGLVPIMGGTYFPKDAPKGMASFMDVLKALEETWRTENDHALTIAQASLAFLKEQNGDRGHAEITPRLLDDSAEAILRLSDQTHGGFGTAPKFPQAPLLSFLLRYASRTNDPEVAYQVELALHGMLRGGIYDQAGGGIARYSTDESWLVPHFEKMLYDNALLLQNLAGAMRLSPSDEWAHTARATAAFLQRDLAAPDGGFYAALSADTEGVEGATYVWTYEQLAEVLTADELALAERELGVTRAGNWEGKNVLTRRDGRANDPEAVDRVLARILEARDARPQPDVDSKVLVSWNALAARGLMEAGDAIDDREMVGLGLATLTLLDDAVSGDEVPHALGEDSAVRLLEDYAALTAACLTAHEVIGEGAWLERAKRLHEATLARFQSGNLLYMTPEKVDLPLRPREDTDSPTPSGAATTAVNAVRLFDATREEGYLDWLRDNLGQFWATADYAPDQAGTALEAYMGFYDAAREAGYTG